MLRVIHNHNKFKIHFFLLVLSNMKDKENAEIMRLFTFLLFVSIHLYLSFRNFFTSELVMKILAKQVEFLQLIITLLKREFYIFNIF